MSDIPVLKGQMTIFDALGLDGYANMGKHKESFHGSPERIHKGAGTPETVRQLGAGKTSPRIFRRRPGSTEKETA